MNSSDKLTYLMNKYKLNDDEKKDFINLISPIFFHNEFQKRMQGEYAHHGSITLGEHILEDTILIYKKINKNNKKNMDIQLAISISMLHDLYTMPWQNNTLAKDKKLIHKHGFRHPLEAVINAYTWYPELFIDENKAKIIIDGILHHMFPLPVMAIKNNNFFDGELNNYELISEIPVNIKRDIIESLQRNNFFSLSFSRSKYKEGRILSNIDKKVSIREIGDLYSFLALITGHNKKIK